MGSNGDISSLNVSQKEALEGRILSKVQDFLGSLQVLVIMITNNNNNNNSNNDDNNNNVDNLYFTRVTQSNTRFDFHCGPQCDRNL